METTPNDLRQQQFDIKLRGYNPDDVEVFRDLAATALEETRAEVLKLTEENKHLSTQLEHLISIEETLKAAVLEAQKNAENTIGNAKEQAKTIIENARKEAELTIKEAHCRRDEVTADMHRQMSRLVGDINKIRFIRANYLSKLKLLVSSQLETIVQAFEEDSDEENLAQPPTVTETPQVDQPQASEVENDPGDENKTEHLEPKSENDEQSHDQGGGNPEDDEEWKKFKEQMNNE